jgi:hypothetical protein
VYLCAFCPTCIIRLCHCPIGQYEQTASWYISGTDPLVSSDYSTVRWDSTNRLPPDTFLTLFHWYHQTIALSDGTERTASWCISSTDPLVSSDYGIVRWKSTNRLPPDTFLTLFHLYYQTMVLSDGTVLTHCLLTHFKHCFTCIIRLWYCPMGQY